MKIGASTNSTVGHEIMYQCWLHFCDRIMVKNGFFYRLNIFSPVKMKVVKCSLYNGTYWDRNIPRYYVCHYGQHLNAIKKTSKHKEEPPKN